MSETLVVKSAGRSWRDRKLMKSFMKLQERWKTEQARKDLERLKLIREQRAEVAKKREEEKADGFMAPMDKLLEIFDVF
ncbi:hypothetical protein Dimus_032699 [Dionaea muscipula]